MDQKLKREKLSKKKVRVDVLKTLPTDYDPDKVRRLKRVGKRKQT